MTAPDTTCSDRVWDVIVCPYCGGKLERASSVVECAACGTGYPRAPSGQLDLRLRGPKQVSTTTTLGREQPAEISCHPLSLNLEADPSLKGSATATGNVNPAAASWLLPARGNGELVLDLGCGSQPLRPLVEAAGFTYVGLDYADPGAHLFGDAHALPFADATFDRVLTIAAMEYFQYPLVAAREVHRVLAPGGQFVGTVGNLLPYLEGMYYNHTVRGVATTLETAGFDVVRLMAPQDWTALVAMAELGLFPAMPSIMARAAVRPVDWLSRLWWWLGRKVRPNRSDSTEIVRLASFFFFVASKAE